MCFYPPTPAFAKARAAPGTTAGVEPVLKSPFASMAPSYRLQAPAICFSRRSRLPFARTPSNAPACRAQAALPATSPSHLFWRAFKAAVCPPPNASRRPCQGNSRSYRPQPSVLKGVQGCRLPAPQMLPQALPGQRSQLQAPAICFEGRSRLPFAGPQMLPQALPRQLSQLQAPAICF